MKLKCSQKSLLPRLQDAAHVASQNSPESPLRRVALSAAAGRINLHAVSARATVRHLWASIPADVTSPGTACVEAQLIAELTASYPKDAEMELSLQGNSRRLKVTCGNSIANLLTGPKPPQEPDLANPQTALLEPQQLHRCLAAALPAASLLPDKPTINGVRLQLDHHGLTLAATDGFRMAVARHGEGGGDPNPIYLILPYQAARDLSKAAARATGPVRLEKDTAKSIARFSIALPENGAARITTYLTVGHFPDPYALMPQKHATRALVCPQAAAASARISASFAGKSDTLLLYLHHQASDTGELKPAATFAVHNSADDRTVHTLPLVALTGPPAHTALNARYLADAFHPLRNARSAAIELSGPEDPTVIRNDDPDSMTQLSMVMPIKVPWDQVTPPPAVIPPTQAPDRPRRGRRPTPRTRKKG